MKFCIKDFFGKCDHIRSFLRIWWHLLKKFLIQYFIFWIVKCNLVSILKLKICCWQFEVFFAGISREAIIMEKACLKLTAELIIFSLQNKNLENIKKVILMDIIIYTEWWMRKNSIYYSIAWQLRSDMQWHFWQITTKAQETHQLILN